MDGLTKALDRSRGIAQSAYSGAMRLKASGSVPIGPSPGLGALSAMQDVGKDRRRYSLFRNWLYSAVHAVASEGASQPVHVGRMQVEEEKGEPKKTKAHHLQKMTESARNKAAEQEMEILLSHPLLSALEEPNPVQRRWQFVYSFIANLNLTGWSYIVKDETEDGKMQFYSLPTTWIRPIHDKGPFAEFRIVDPNKPLSAVDDDTPPLTRDQVAFAHLPNPSDPMSALAPAESQMMAIRIDDHIQSSQEQYFNNGIFPSVIVTVGKDPHPDVPGGIRPRLTAPQRRQVHSAIAKTMKGVANYGNPAIVDGLIENIERLSMGGNEMGWEKSEQSARTRLLSAFGVHPYILGEPVNVGGYAQAAKIEERYCKRVNVFLDMLGCVMTNFVGPDASEDGDLVVWWEKCEPNDPSLKWQNIRHARDRDDITQNEYRAMLGLPPDEDRNESVIGKQAAQIVQVLGQKGQGIVTRDQAIGFLVGMGLPDDLAERIAGEDLPPPPPPELGQATDALENATDQLQEDPKEMEKRVEEIIKGWQDQPRVPPGSSAGGQWGGVGWSWGGGGGSEGDSWSKPGDKPKPESKPSGSYREQHKGWMKGLSGKEKDAFLHYTGEDGYKSIRNCQNKGKGCTGKTKENISTLSNAMNRAPKYEGTVFRGLSFNKAEERDAFLARVKKNGELTDKGFTSTSKSRDVAWDFARNYGKGDETTGILFRIKSKNGVEIEKLSDVKAEKEVLLGPNSKLRFAGINPRRHLDMVVVDLEEV